MRTVSATIVIAIIATMGVPARAQRNDVPTTGTFVDRAGAQHPWSITSSHALQWDRQTYVPVGGTFAPRYFANGQTDANWDKDVEALGILKARGVQDIIVNPIVSAPDVPAAAWQKLVDYLDANGFRYGIAFGAGVKSPLAGTIVKPGSYRVANVGDTNDAYWTVSDADTARYLFTDKDGAVILKTGEVRVQNGIAGVTAGPKIPSGSIGLLYPRKVFRTSSEGYLPDLWVGFDSYRDRLLAVFSIVKFGPGLRFFLDPLAHPLGIMDETDYMVPDSAAFRLEWEAYLSQTYTGIDDLMARWGLQDKELGDYKHAATLVPLNSAGRGVAFMLDTMRNKVLACDPNMNSGRFWSDLRDCRNNSVIYYMKAVSDLLKKEIANVPVVFTRTMHPRMFRNAEKRGGFDGVGIAAYARGSALVTGGADSAYSDAQESAKNLWLVVTETLDTNSPEKAQIGYASEQSLVSDLDWLRTIGAKGFFVNGFQVLPEERYANFQLLRSPEQVDWLKRYRERLSREVDIALSRPNTLAYPACAAGLVHSGPIGRGSAMWVLSPAPGRSMEFGSSFAGYTIGLAGGDKTVLWSLRGPRETYLRVVDPRTIEVTTPEGIPIPFKANVKTRTIVLTMPEGPVVIRPGSEQIFPIEAAEDTMGQLRELVLQAQDAKLPVDQFRYHYNMAFRSFKTDPKAAFITASDALNGIGAMLQPWAWIEAERAETHSFSEAVVNDAASGGGYLMLNTETDSPAQGYAAQLHFIVPADDQYTIWLSCAMPGPSASPFAWLIDASSQVNTSTDAIAVGQPYLSDKMTWLKLGRFSLKKGEHTFTLRVAGRAPGTGKFSFAMDCLFVTRNAFTPSGISKPPLAAVTANSQLQQIQNIPREPVKKPKR